MIKRIFFDLDHTLIYSSTVKTNQEHLKIYLDCGEFYYTVVRPSAKNVIEFARDLVGDDNVFILTASTKDYATEICKKANFGFPASHIHSREDLENYTFCGAYGAEHYMMNPNIGDKNNVLIDNLSPLQNMDKMCYIDIGSNNYLQVQDYYGTNNKEDEFFTKVSEFLLQKNEK